MESIVLNRSKLVKRIAIGVVALVTTSLLIMSAYWIIRPTLLTHQYGDELERVILNYEELRLSLDRNANPTTLSTVAVGEQLDFLVKYACTLCTEVQVGTKVGVDLIRVLSYSTEQSEVIARIEHDWSLRDLRQGNVVGPCHATAFTTSYLLRKVDGIWKVAYTGNIEVPPYRVDDSAELLAEYC